ncbi:MAG: hypothetical protein GX660_11720 [Clostridiaceae bacterium]|nr:hypothetical protein [Clostridiaceae bacterium]
MMSYSTPETFSLLWPDSENGREMGKTIPEDDFIVANLELGNLAKALTIDSLHVMSIGTILSALSDNTDVINYRLDIIDDLLRNHEIVESLTKIMPFLDELSLISYHRSNHDILLQETASRVGELDTYVYCIKALNSVFESSKSNIKSSGLRNLHYRIRKIAEDTEFVSLSEELPSLMKGLRKISSVTLGVNFNARLNPVEFTIVSINEEPFKENTLLHRLFNKKSHQDFTGISPIVDIKPMETVKHNQLVTVPNPFHVALFKELNNVTSAACKPIAEAAKKYVKINSRFLSRLKPEIIFILGAVKLIKTIQSAGLIMCKPEVLPKSSRACKICGIFNINLALSMHYNNPEISLESRIVTNDVDIGDNGRIFILTGPNQGGKTTYTQAIGLAQLLFQLGIYVPGTKASISTVDRIYTHFPVEEKPDTRMGRLGEESKRLNDIFKKATPYSLILLNESLQSTSPYEGLYISREVIMTLKLLGARAIFATHFHELAEKLDELNSYLQGDSKVVSLISGVVENKESTDEFSPAQRTYKIIPGVPQGMSYAKDIASRYGLSFEKLVGMLSERKIIDLPPDQ